MSLITLSIRVLKILNQASPMRPKSVPSFLEEVHQSLMAMSGKESTTTSQTGDDAPQPALQRVHVKREIQAALAEVAAVSAASLVATDTESAAPAAPRRGRRKGSTNKVVAQPAPVAAAAPLQPVPAVTVEQSAQSDTAVICLMCGTSMKMLARHIRSAHQMDEKQYRHTFGLSQEHPLEAPALSRQRKERNAKLGLVEKMKLGRQQARLKA